MQDNILVTYQGQTITPAPQISYSTNLNNVGDLVVGYTHTVTLRGYCISSPNQNPPNGLCAVHDLLALKNIFNSNGGSLRVTYQDTSENIKIILQAVDVKIVGIGFQESPNNWSKYIPYVVELECNHLHLSDNQIGPLAGVGAEQGGEDFAISQSLHSNNIVDITKYKIKSFSENVSFSMEDGIFDQIELAVEDPETNQQLRSYINNNYFMINYNLSAIGKHDITTISDPITGFTKTTLPAWESAKRFVHTRMLLQLTRLINGVFLTTNNYDFLQNIHGNNVLNPPTVEMGSDYNLFNEVVNFNVSESDGSFDVQYSVLVKKTCPAQDNLGCSNNALHKITKKVDRTFTANEKTNDFVTEISITIDGEITGLVPGAGLASLGRLALEALPNQGGTGSFLTIRNDNTAMNNSKDHNAAELLKDIMVFGRKEGERFDFKTDFKKLLGINYSALEVAEDTEIKPSRISITRNPLNGTISYTATYDNKFNCDRNHFAIDISVENPTPVIAEFVIPNNSLQDENGITLRNQDGTPQCPGHSVIQQLGTQTAKKINVAIKGNTGLDFKRCCLGNDDDKNPNDLTNPNWDLLSLDYFNMDEFILPTGLKIPEFGPKYILTQKNKKMSFPKGEFDITLSYTLADVCDVDIGLEQ